MDNQINKFKEAIKDPKLNSNMNSEIPVVSELKKWYSDFYEFGKEVLKYNKDYGIIPGVKKPILFKSGAEKIKNALNFEIELLDCVKEINDYQKNYFDFTYKCIISSNSGVKLGICEGNANSRESRFRYLFKPALKIPDKRTINFLKAEGKGKWVIIENRWVWYERVENDDIYSLKNSIQKVAQKRAFVGAILMACGVSEFFSQEN